MRAFVSLAVSLVSYSILFGKDDSYVQVRRESMHRFGHCWLLLVKIAVNAAAQREEA